MTWTSYEGGRRHQWRPPTQDGVARALAEAQAGRLRYCHDARTWFVWDGAVWRRDRTGTVLALIRDLARELGTDPGGRTVAGTGGSPFVVGVERFARGEAALAVTAEAWDADPLLLGTPNGPIALGTGAPMPADPRDGITRATAVAPAASADCPLWRRFLAETFAGDDEVIGFLQRFLGYVLTGSVVEHVLVYGWGAGGNGKSVLLDTVLELLGDYARPATLATLESSDAGRHGAALAALHGVRLVGIAESDGGRGWNERRVKILTGGDPIAGWPATGNRPTCKLLVTGNHPPCLAMVDEAMRRRLRIVPFPYRPEHPDRGLAAKLRAEGPGILRWMIQGCLAWQAEGLGQPAAVAAATADALDGQDPFGQFLAERCEGGPSDAMRSTSAAALYAAWRVWADAAGEPAGSQRAFATVLAVRGFRRDRTERARFYRGLSLREPDERPDA